MILEPRALAALFPAAPMVLGRPDYATWACDATMLREEEAFWLHGQELLGDRYRQLAQLGFGIELGRGTLSSPATPGERAATLPTALAEPGAAPTERSASPEAPPTPRLTPRPGTSVRVRRSNGLVEEHWTLARVEERGRCILQQRSFTKAVSLIELVILNPELIAAGTPVRVPRSSGAVDDGWTVKSVERSLVIVEKPGLGRKGLTPEQLLGANPGLVGSDSDEETASLVAPVVGSPVRVRRSTGEREEGWVVADRMVDMEVPVLRETLAGVLEKQVPLDVLLEDNPSLLPRDLPLRVMRSNGSLDDGWLVRDTDGEQVVLERPDVGEKAASPRDLLAWNRDRLLHELSSAVGKDHATWQGMDQAARFRRQGRLDEVLLDGYWDASPHGGRPAFLVHRGEDMALAPALAFARELTGRPASERVLHLAEIVWEFMGEAASATLPDASGPAVEQGILLGDVPRLLGAGNNLARALMFSVLAAEAGLRTSLVRGALLLPGVRGTHVWCEVALTPEETVLVDLSLSPPPAGRGFPSATHPSIRACYVAQEASHG